MVLADQVLKVVKIVKAIGILVLYVCMAPIPNARLENYPLDWSVISLDWLQKQSKELNTAAIWMSFCTFI